MKYVVNVRRNGSIGSVSHEAKEDAGMSIIVRDSSDQEVGAMIKAFSELMNSKSLRNAAIAASINDLISATGFQTIPENQIIDLLKLKP